MLRYSIKHERANHQRHAIKKPTVGDVATSTSPDPVSNQYDVTISTNTEILNINEKVKTTIRHPSNTFFNENQNSLKSKQKVNFNKNKNQICKLDLPSNITPKLAKQLESVRELSKSKIEISHNASRSNRRDISIRSAEDKIIEPLTSDTIQIQPNQALKIANYFLSPIPRKRGPLSRLHMPDAIINSDTGVVFVTNTSEKQIIIQSNTRMGVAVELTSYDIPVVDEGNLQVDTIFSCDNAIIRDPF